MDIARESKSIEREDGTLSFGQDNVKGIRSCKMDQLVRFGEREKAKNVNINNKYRYYKKMRKREIMEDKGVYFQMERARLVTPTKTIASLGSTKWVRILRRQ